jgi:hypothetical protein
MLHKHFIGKSTDEKAITLKNPGSGILSDMRMFRQQSTTTHIVWAHLSA